LNEAVSAGVELMYGDAAQALTSSSHHVTVTTRSGRQIEAGAATVTAGPWIPRHLLPELALHLVPKRVPIYWFAPKPGREAQFQKDRFPIFLYECTDGSLLYGIPAGASEEQGVKIGFHNRQQLACDVETAAPAISAEMRGLISKYVSSILPDLIAEPVDEKWCIYTMSPDESFLMGESERQAGVFYASACSGHGFKFAPGIGNALASMALRQAPAVDVAHFLATRLGSGEPAIIGARHFSAG